VRLWPEPNVDRPVDALRDLLKLALRICGLRCVSVVEQTPSRRKAVP
jgi:hypothetical protein